MGHAGLEFHLDSSLDDKRPAAAGSDVDGQTAATSPERKGHARYSGVSRAAAGLRIPTLMVELRPTTIDDRQRRTDDTFPRTSTASPLS